MDSEGKRKNSVLRFGHHLSKHSMDLPSQLPELTAATIANGWAENSSCTGVPNIARSQGTGRRTIWIILVIIGLGATIAHMYSMVDQYLGYSVNVNIDLSHETQLTFPAVTLCNVNAVRESMLSLGGPDMMAIFPLSQGTTNDTVDSSGRADTRLAFANQFASLSADTQESMGHQLDDMLLDCIMDGVACSSANFTHFVNTKYGNCYTLNEDATLLTHRPGANNGVSMEIFLEQSEYIPDLTESAGLVVVLHDSMDTPFPEDNGIFIQPATETNIALKQLSITRLEDPYPEACWYVTDAELASLSLYSERLGTGYSSEACVKSCFQSTLYQTCGCGDAYFPLYGTMLNGNNASRAIDPCEGALLECELGVIADYKLGNLNCNCSVPCEELRYDSVVSQAKWPNVKYESYYKEKLKTLSSSLTNIINDNTMTVSEHVLKLNVFYTDLNKETVSESPAYPWTTLLADLGGVIGLYLGLSVVAVAEFAELLFDLGVYGGNCKIKRPRTVSQAR